MVAEIVSNLPSVSANVDLGQILVASSLWGVAWFVKREIVNVGKRLDKHEEIITELVGKVQYTVGMVNGIIDRRKHQRDG